MSKLSRPARRHHYVPQAYLRRWTDGGCVHVWDKEKGAGFSTSPRHVAYRRDFHAERGEEPDRFERAFTERTERPQMIALSELLSDLRGGGTLTPEHRAGLDDLLVTQLLRVPRMRDFIRQVLPALGVQLDAREYHLAMLDGRSRVRDLLRHDLRALEVRVLTAPAGAAFWTSDAPVISGRVGPTGGLQMHWRTPLNDPQTQLLLPLAPEFTVLYGRPHTLPPGGVRRVLTVDDVRKVNDLTFVNGERQVFSVAPLTPPSALLDAERVYRTADWAAQARPMVLSAQERSRLVPPLKNR